MPHLARLLTLAVVASLLVAPSALAQTVADCGTDPVQPPTPVDPAAFDEGSFATPIGSYKAAGFDASGAEIVAFDADTARVFTVNSVTTQVDVLDASDPTDPVLVGCLALGGPPTSVAVLGDGFAAVSYQADPKTDPGLVVVVDRDGGQVAGPVEVGPAVDALTATPDGTRLLAANEGEIPDDYSSDPSEIPEGSVSVIEVPDDAATLTQADVTTIGFDGLDAIVAADPDIRRAPADQIPTYQQDFEPEYVVADETSSTAYVSLQESSAIAVLDLETLAFTDVFGLPVVDHSQDGAFISPSDEPYGNDPLDAADGTVPDAAFADPANTGRASWPVSGMPMPDGIAVLTAESGTTYVLTAEEGDGREWGEQPDESLAYADEARIEDLADEGLLCDGALSDDELAAVGRLTVSRFDGFRDGAGCIERPHAFGTRGMGVYDATTGDRVWHSGDDFEAFGLEAHPRFFNSDHAAAAYLDRSDNKGPEPEYVELGEVGDRTYAFVGLERISAIAVYDVTDPTAPEPVDYLYDRDFDAQLGDDENPLAGDLGPEGLDFVPAADSPTRRPLLVVGNEVSGSTTIWEVDVDSLPDGPGDGGPDGPPVDGPGDGLPTGDEVVRLAGADRVATAVEVSRASFGDGEADTVVLASAGDYPDALAGTPVAVAAGGPLLVTPTDDLADVAAAELQRVLPESGTVHVLGGEVAIDATVEQELVDLGYDVVRIAGPSRIETALAAAAFLGDPTTLLVTTGYAAPDALVAGPAAAVSGAAVLLTSTDVPHPAVDAYLAAGTAETVTAIGGPATRAYPDAAPVAGTTRAGTAVAVAEAFFDAPPVVGLAGSDAFADALAGGAHIGRLGGPLLLSLADELAPETADYVCRGAATIDGAFAYGGPDVLGDEVLDALGARLAGEGC